MTGSFSVEGAKVCVAGQRSRTDPKRTFPLDCSRFSVRAPMRGPVTSSAKLEREAKPLYRRRPERNEESEPLHVPRQADPSRARELLRGEAGKIVNAGTRDPGNAATIPEIAVGIERKGGQDAPPPMRWPRERFVCVMVRRVESHPHAVDMRSRSKCNPGIADQTIAVECSERHISPGQRAMNEFGVHVEFRIASRLQEFLRPEDPDRDAVWKMRLGERPDEISYQYPLDV